MNIILRKSHQSSLQGQDLYLATTTSCDKWSSECFGTMGAWSEIWAKKCVCLTGGMEVDGLWDKGHVVWTQRWPQMTIPNPDVEPIPSSLACRHCPWMCAEKRWNAVITCAIKTLSWRKSLAKRSAAELERHQPLFYPYTLVVDTALWNITIFPNFTCWERWTSYLLPWRLPTALLCPANSPSSPPAVTFWRWSICRASSTQLQQATSAAHLKAGMERFRHISETSILVPLNPDSGFMHCCLWNAAFPRTCTCSAGGGSLVHLLPKGNIIPGRCLPPCQWWGTSPSGMEKPQLSWSSPLFPDINF